MSKRSVYPECSGLNELNPLQADRYSSVKTIILTIFLFIMSVQLSNAQWQPDVRLTNDPAGSSVMFNTSWAIASNRDNVHIVFRDLRDGNAEIYYKRSTDGGISWGADIRLTNDPAASANSSIAIAGSVVHIIWNDDRNGNWEIYYKRSTDGGVNWGADTRLTNDAAISQAPSVSVSGQVVNIGWYDTRDGNNEIYYKRSTDGGVSWGADTRLTNDPASSLNCSISVSGSFAHIVWVESRDGNPEIYYKRSTDGGLNWGADINLTNHYALSTLASISVSGSVVHVVWADNRDQNMEIYYKRSTDNGTSWEADTRLTNNSASSNYSNITVSGTMVHVVWVDTRDFNEQIYYKRSTDSGDNWEADVHLSLNLGLAQHPTVSVSGSAVHTVWRDTRDANYEIYYKRNPNGNTIGIININSEVPKQFLLHQNYPNPFNPNTKIKFALTNNTFAKLVIYDALGREQETLVNEQLNAGNYEADWSADRYSSGIYFYKLTSGEFSQTNKMILLK